jgi:biopolymer transport protein ExbB
MNKYQIVGAALLGSIIAIGQVAAQEPTNLTQLLELVRRGQAQDDSDHRQRLTEFNQRQAEQTQLLQQARTRKANEEARSAQLDMTFDENEILITQVQTQLNERLGSLRELFGVLQQVAGDARSNFDNSLTNIEFPERSEFLTDIAAKVGQGSQLPSIEEIERLWFELQREATELGKVKRIPNFRIVTAGGEESFEDVVRIGAFNIVADGRYLQHATETNSISELQRQPAGRFTASTSALLDAQPGDGMVRFGVDISRGQILSLLIRDPGLFSWERVQQGAEVGYVIIGLGILGILLALERFITLSIASSKVRAQLRRDTPSANNALGRVLMVYQKNTKADVETLELKLGEAILKETPSLQRGILFIKIISVVAPLLGLLGTVTGMINTFQAITLYGAGDPTIMAGGISQALVTTVLGLVVAIPMVLLHTIVNGRSRGIIQILQEQSAGIVAEQAEKVRGQ